MNTASTAITSYEYTAHTADGQPVNGSIEAPDIDAAAAKLASLNLRVTQIEPQRNRRARQLSANDFVAFNQQLAHLTAAGLPIEHGLRLIADDLNRGRLAGTIQQVAHELESGKPLAEAFASHQRSFPPLYARLIEAGVRSHNLPEMLLNIGKHAEMVQRLRAAVWRAVAYPLVVFIAMLLVLIFLNYSVLPPFAAMFANTKPMPAFYWRPQPQVSTAMPMITQIVMFASSWVLPIASVVLITSVLLLVITPLLRGSSLAVGLRDSIVLRLPLIGAPLRWNLVARWCDAARVGVASGLDLPAALDLASSAVSSPKLHRDTARLIETLSAGQGLDRGSRPELLPVAIPAVLEIASKNADLPRTLATLSEMYQQEAEIRLSAIPAILTPILLIIMAALIGSVIAALMLPLFRLLSDFGMNGL